MAKRAALLEAYKNLTRELGEVRSSVAQGTGHETVSGFLRGVELKETRYYEGGDVEVDVEVRMPALPARAGAAAMREPASGGAKELLLVEKGGGVISESEWREILGAGGDARP